MSTQKEFQNFCRNVFLLRKYAGMSQKDLAAILHISVNTLRKLESGTIPPRMGVDVIFILANTFHVPPAALFEPFTI